MTPLLVMKMEIRYSPKFRKYYKNADTKIKTAFNNRIQLFEVDPHNLLLHNHSLMGRYRGYRSINVTGDWRAIYLEKKTSDGRVLVEFRLFGTHSQLYK